MPFPQVDFAILLAVAGLGGLAIGSFLNVVVHRLPIMIERELDAAARDHLADDSSAQATPEDQDRFDLCWPPSRCPSCERRIAPWDNLPLISYLRLRGRCGGCGAGISPRYPLIEALTALLFLAVAWRFGASWETPLGWLFTGLLIAQSAIDLDRKLLPDELVYLLLWPGLLASLFADFAEPSAAIIGAAVGYTALYLLRWIWLRALGRDALGLGDAKLVAALGAWLGWQALPSLLLMAALLAIAVTLALRLVGPTKAGREIAFGPYLAAAGFVHLLFAADLQRLLAAAI